MQSCLRSTHVPPCTRVSTLNCRRGLHGPAGQTSWLHIPGRKPERERGEGCLASGPTVRSDGARTRQSSEPLSARRDLLPVNRREGGAATCAAARPREGGCGAQGLGLRNTGQPASARGPSSPRVLVAAVGTEPVLPSPARQHP